MLPLRLQASFRHGAPQRPHHVAQFCAAFVREVDCIAQQHAHGAHFLRALLAHCVLQALLCCGQQLLQSLLAEPGHVELPQQARECSLQCRECGPEVPSVVRTLLCARVLQHAHVCAAAALQQAAQRGIKQVLVGQFLLQRALQACVQALELSGWARQRRAVAGGLPQLVHHDLRVGFQLPNHRCHGTPKVRVAVQQPVPANPRAQLLAIGTVPVVKPLVGHRGAGCPALANGGRIRVQRVFVHVALRRCLHPCTQVLLHGGTLLTVTWLCLRLVHGAGGTVPTVPKSSMPNVRANVVVWIMLLFRHTQNALKCERGCDTFCPQNEFIGGLALITCTRHAHTHTHTLCALSTSSGCSR